MLKALARAGQAVDEVGHEHNVELAKAVPKEGRVALLEPGAGAVDAAWHFGDGRLAKLAFDGERVVEPPVLLELGGSGNEALGKVDAYGFGAVPG